MLSIVSFPFSSKLWLIVNINSKFGTLYPDGASVSINVYVPAFNPDIAILPLSSDVNTAIKVGSRHGKPVILDIDTDEMKKRGAKLYKSENNVYLTKNVPVGCFTKHL